LRLSDEGIVSTDADWEEMDQMKKGIDEAAQKQQPAVAIARAVAFVAVK
jgi:hypothetical protein